MLGREIRDPSRSESHIEQIEGIGLLPIKTMFDSDKITRQVRAIHLDSDIPFKGYEIHMGRSIRIHKDIPAVFKVLRLAEDEEILDGARNKDGSIWGTYLHGIFDNRTFLRHLINQWRLKKGLLPQDMSTDIFIKDKEYDKLANLVRDNIDVEFLYNILNRNQTNLFLSLGRM